MANRAKRYKYRCNRCRTRNSFVKKLEHYLRPRRCRCCGHDRFYVDRERMRRRYEHPCKCDGCHYPHRPGSSVCFDNPYYGIDRFEAEGGRVDQECPF